MKWKVASVLLALWFISACAQATPTPTPAPPTTPGITATPQLTPGAIVSSPTATPTYVEIKVEATVFKFTPDTVTISQGETVKLKLVSLSLPHTFTVDELGLDVLIPAGGQVEKQITASRSGAFKLYCRFHTVQNMVGTLVVKGEGGISPPLTPTPATPQGPTPTPGGEYPY